MDENALPEPVTFDGHYKRINPVAAFFAGGCVKDVRPEPLRYYRVGKRRAGRLLDGQLWEQWPEVAR